MLTGLFTQIVLPRSPTTISVSLENLAGSKQATIADPSLATYRDALSGILDAEITGSTPANLYSEIEQVHSEEQLNVSWAANSCARFKWAPTCSSEID